MSEDVFDILKACEKGAWSAAVVSLAIHPDTRTHRM